MREPTSCRPSPLTDQQPLHDTMTIATRFLPLSADGYRCQTDDLWRLLLAAAARHSTLESACADLDRAPDANTLRGHLNAQRALAPIPELQQHYTQLLASLLPEWLKARPQEVAIDFHDEPYYGREDAEADQKWVCRGEARAGTTRFYRCATAYLMVHDARLTLALVFVKPSRDKVEVLSSLLAALKAAGITIKCLYADTGFGCIPVLRYLARRPIAAIIAMPIRGKQGGTRKLCRGRRSYRTAYTLQSAEHGTVCVPVAVVRTVVHRRAGERQVRWLVYGCLRVGGPVVRVRRRYRRRLGIESGYRLLEQVRARTSSRNPAVRFRLMGIALMISNMWIRLHWRYLRLSGSGPRRGARWCFRLDRMMRFLTRAIERFYGVVTAVAFAPAEHL